MPFYPTLAVGVVPANPTAIASSTYLMNGLGVAGANALAFTPTGSGRIIVSVSGDLLADATARVCAAQLSYGTGTAPANAAAVAGTQYGAQLAWTSLTGMLTMPFTLSALVTGLTIGTAYWFDVNSKASAGTVQLTNLNAWVMEV